MVPSGGLSALYRYRNGHRRSLRPGNTLPRGRYLFPAGTLSSRGSRPARSHPPRKYPRSSGRSQGTGAAAGSPGREDLADLPVAPGAKAPTLGLDMHGRISEREPGDEKVPIVHHPDAGRCAHVAFTRSCTDAGSVADNAPYVAESICMSAPPFATISSTVIHRNSETALCSIIRSMSSFPQGRGLDCISRLFHA